MYAYLKIEMPRTCYDCKLRRRNGLELICPVLERSYKIADTQILFVREKDCPLIEVPEPHGRLIDADALHKLFEYQWHYLQVLDWNENPTAEAKQSGINWCINTMHDDAPTVIPASESKERPAFLPTYELTPRKTNADRIRRMSDKELAELLVSTDGDFPPNCEDVPVRKLEAYWLDWLRQEAANG